MIKRYLEIETKYNAKDVLLSEFKAFCEQREPLKVIMASGYDHFYAKDGEAASFCRHRTGPDRNEFTFKQKTVAANNTIRHEVNVQMVPEESDATAAALAGSFGYNYNTSIFKTCFVYVYEWYTLVLYITYNMEMQELDRLFEIEMKEDHPWQSEDDAWTQLTVLEKLCKPLGASPQARIKRSLFEMYRK